MKSNMINVWERVYHAIKIIIRQQLHFLIMYTYIHLLTHLGRIHIPGINTIIAIPVLDK